MGSWWGGAGESERSTRMVSSTAALGEGCSQTLGLALAAGTGGGLSEVAPRGGGPSDLASRQPMSGGGVGVRLGLRRLRERLRAAGGRRQGGVASPGLLEPPAARLGLRLGAGDAS